MLRAIECEPADILGGSDKAAWVTIGKLTRLEWLNVPSYSMDSKLHSSEMQNIAALTSLKRLELKGRKLESKNMLQFINKLTKLQWLDIQDFGHLTFRITDICLTHNYFDGDELSIICRLPDLRSLHVSIRSAPSIAWLSSLCQLQGVNVRVAEPLTSASFGAMACLTRLSRVNITSDEKDLNFRQV